MWVMEIWFRGWLDWMNRVRIGIQDLRGCDIKEDFLFLSLRFDG